MNNKYFFVVGLLVLMGLGLWLGGVFSFVQISDGTPSEPVEDLPACHSAFADLRYDEFSDPRCIANYKGRGDTVIFFGPYWFFYE